MTRNTLVPILVVLAACGVIAVWASSRSIPAEESESATGIRHIVLVTIDTLRADALSVYDPRGVEARSLERLAGDGTVFERAIAPSPWTRPSIASMLTGLPPRVHSLIWREFDDERALPPEIRTVAERLADAGYRTAAFGYNPFLANSATLRRGFRDFVFHPRVATDGEPGARDPYEPGEPLTQEASTEVLTSLATGWLADHADEPFFLWLHYYDPHLPYSAPKRHRTRLAAGARHPREALGPLIEETLREFRKQWSREAGWGTGGPPPEHPLTAQDAGAVRALYEEEVRYVDEQLGLVLDTLDRLGLTDETLVIVTSDHGEEFWDHGGLEHGHLLHEEVMHVPMIARMPGGVRRRVSERVSLLSVFSTLLEAAAVTPAPEQSVVPSLMPTIRDGSPPPALAELVIGNRLFGEAEDGIYFGDLKFTRTRKTKREALYDLRRDPLERNNLIERDPATAQRARGRLDAFTKWAAEQRKRLKLRHTSEARNSEAAKKLLREHGYLR